MVTFYPRDIGMWRQVFKFGIELTNRPHKSFHNRSDLIEFLKEHGVEPIDAACPLEFRVWSGTNPSGSDNNVHAVIWWTLIGWIKE